MCYPIIGVKYPDRTYIVSTNGNNTINGACYHHGNGGNNAVWGGIAKESVGLGVAEFVSMGASLGVVAIADQVAPRMLKDCSKMLGKLIRPYLETIENGLQKVCKLEECQPDKTKPPEQRAEALAKTIIVFSSAWAISMAAKLGTRIAMNKLMHLPSVPSTGNWLKDMLPQAHDLRVVAWDEGVHLGALLLMNTASAKTTDSMIKGTTNMLKRWGLPEQKAKEVASMGIIWELPNLLGLAAGVGAIANDHFKTAKLGKATSHVERLNQQTALSGALTNTRPVT